jgi:hypothetical protein
MPDERTYIKVHDGMPDHPKVEPLSDAAFRLLVTTWCWSSRHLQDGRLKEASWLKRGNPKTRAELMSAGLVEEIGPGLFQVHDYLEHQRSAAEVQELRDKRREAGSKGGKAKANAMALAKQKLKQTGSKDVPESETEELEESSSGKPRKRGHRLPDEWQPTTDDVKWARTEGIDDLAARRETEKFRDHWHAASGQNASKLNWSLAWRNWMRNGVDRSPKAARPVQDSSWMQSMPGDAS